MNEFRHQIYQPCKEVLELPSGRKTNQQIIPVKRKEGHHEFR